MTRTLHAPAAPHSTHRTNPGTTTSHLTSDTTSDVAPPAVPAAAPDPASAVTVRPLDVVCVPAGHPYVEHLLPVGDTTASTHLGTHPGTSTGTPGVQHRADPDPDDPTRAATGRWWPPVALRADWLASAGCDVLHVHFGFDDRSPAELADLLATARRQGVPVVLTVHDLRSPHQPDRARLDAQLDVLVPGADAVLTLTTAAADEIGRRWGRDAVVVPHPHLVDLDLAARLRAERRARPRLDPPVRVVGLAVKSLRPNTDPLRLLPTLEQVVATVPGASLRVGVHHDLRNRDDTAARDLVDWLDAAAARGVDVRWHDRLDDEQLARELAELHVAVLPYRFGTHSGWLEACHDVGTRVLAPSHGCYAAQGADGVHLAGRDGDDGDDGDLDLGSLAAELHRLLAADPHDLVGLEADERAAQRDHVAAVHERLYRGLLAGRGGAEREVTT